MTSIKCKWCIASEKQLQCDLASGLVAWSLLWQEVIPSAWGTVLIVPLVMQEHSGVIVLSRAPPQIVLNPSAHTHVNHCHCSCVFRCVHGSQAAHVLPSRCHPPGSLLTLPLDISPLWNVLSLPVCQLLLLLIMGINSYTWAKVFFPDKTNFVPIRKKTYFFPSVD